MARKTTTLTIDEPGRDFGKVFVLTEMPADQAERWAMRAILALTNAGAELPDNFRGAGMATMAAIGLTALSNLRWETVEPLIAEMFECVQYKHGPNVPLQAISSGVNSQIEEVLTRVTLRKAVFDLHINFSSADAPPGTDQIPIPRMRSA